MQVGGAYPAKLYWSAHNEAHQVGEQREQASDQQQDMQEKRRRRRGLTMQLVKLYYVS